MRLRWLVPGVVGVQLLLAGCGSAPPSSASSSTPTAQPSATESPSATASPSPSPSNGPCRLPVAALQQGAPNYSGGYVTYPGGGFSPDPNGNVNYNQSTRLYETSAQPQLTGSNGPPTYTHASSRWVPAPFATLAPDNTHYAYSYFPGAQPWTSHSEIHLVDVTTATDRVVYRGGSYFVLDYEPEGIYLYSGHYGAEGYTGLWLLNPGSGQLRQLESGGFWYRIGAGAAWGGDTVAGDQPTGIAPMTRVLRRDLKTGAVTPWFHRSNGSVEVVGFDAGGHPFVSLTQQDGSMELWLLNSPSSAQKIWSGGNGSLVFEGDPLPDSMGVWFGLMSGIWLYHDGTLEKVSSTAGAVAGRCV